MAIEYGNRLDSTVCVEGGGVGVGDGAILGLGDGVVWVDGAGDSAGPAPLHAAMATTAVKATAARLSPFTFRPLFPDPSG
jgi:hypothetical protein